MKVLKIGGASLGSAERFREAASIISAVAESAKADGNGTPNKNIVVVSAMAGTTDSLAEIAGYIYNRNPEGTRDTIAALRKKYAGVISGLFDKETSKKKAQDYAEAVFGSITACSKELFTEVQERIILAQGELLSSCLMATLLEERGIKVQLLPALSFMRTDANGEPDADAIKSSLKKLIDSAPDADIYLTEGYICMNAREEIDNLGRGGSDLTACLVGAAIQAEEIQLWTNIDGLHDNDPRIVEGTAPVRHLNFEEAAELTYFGSRILHPTCILPARYANVPVRVLNTTDPQALGTLIDNTPDAGAIKAVAAKDNITAIKIKSSRMLQAHGFLRKVFEIFESYHTSIDMICTSEVGVSLTIDDTRYLNEIVHDLKQYGTVSVDLDMCIICVVGDMDWNNRGFEARAMDALKDIPVRMVSYGGSNYNISFLVREEDKAAALRALSSKLFSNG